ncbi:hypothetical protein CRENBAI_011605, partial [Crenichthys baileyi]
MKGVIKVQALLDFSSLRSTEANCFPESSHQRPLSLKTPSGAVFPSLKEGQRDRITVATAVTCTSAGQAAERAAPPYSSGENKLVDPSKRLQENICSRHDE